MSEYDRGLKRLTPNHAKDVPVRVPAGPPRRMLRWFAPAVKITATMSSDDPAIVPEPLTVSPGTIPEAAELEQLAFGLMGVRERINRETAGAVSPSRQLRAVDQLLQRNHSAISVALKAASSRHDRVIDAGDAFRLTIALAEHATLAYYWLRLGAHLTRVPPPIGRPAQPLSATKSAVAREGVLKRINSSAQFADELVDQLGNIAPQGTIAETSLMRLCSQLVCVRVLAALLVWDLTERRPMPRSMITTFLGRVESLRISDDFLLRSDSDKDLILQTSAALLSRQGLDDQAEELLRERLELSRKTPDMHLRAVLELLPGKKSAAERLALLRELDELAGDSRIGCPFSDERIGRLSTFRDYLWGTAISAERETGVDGAAIRLAFNCQSRWLYAHECAAPAHPVWLCSDWSRRGQVTYLTDAKLRNETWDVEPEQIERLHQAMEKLSPSDCKPMRDVTRWLDTTLGPALTEALQLRTELRLMAGGPVSRAPILATKVGGTSLGASVNVAFAHPNPEIAGHEPLREPVELLIIDECFGERSLAVRHELEAAARLVGKELKVIAFASSDPAKGLSHDELGQALVAARSVVIFSHFDNPLEYAQWASMVTAESERFRTGDLAALDLRYVQELTIVGCGSGRSNPFLGDAAFAHAAANAGAGQVIYSIWPISAKRGAEFVVGLSQALRLKSSAIEYLAGLYERNRAQAASFAVLRP